MFASLSDLQKELWLRLRSNGDIKVKKKDGNIINLYNLSNEDLISLIQEQIKIDITKIYYD